MDRYFIRGFIDGLLSTLGVVIGASTAIGTGSEIEVSRIIIAAGISGGIANGTSNILGAFMGEKVAAHKRFKEIEKAMLKEEALRGTKVDEKAQNKVISSGILDGLATIGGAIIPVFPFILVAALILSSMTALTVSIGLSLVVFFVLGVYIGKISKENIIFSGLKLVAFGAATAVIAHLIKVLL